MRKPSRVLLLGIPLAEAEAQLRALGEVIVDRQSDLKKALETGPFEAVVVAAGASDTAEGDKRRRIEHEQFFELMPDLLAVLGPDGSLRRVNGAWQRLLGWSPPELVGRRNTWLLHPDDVGAVEKGRQVMMGGEGRFNEEVRLRCKNGSYRTIRWTALAVPSEQRFYLLGRDVTEERRAEGLVRASEQRYRVLFNGSPIAKWIYDTETLRFLEVNDAAVQTYGYSREEFLAMTLEDIRPSEDLPQFQADLAKVKDTEANLGIWRHRRKDGKIIDVEVTALPLDLGGRKTRLIATRDLSEQRAYEAQLLERARLSELTADVGIALTRGDTLREILQICAEAMVARLGVTLAKIWTLDGDKRLLELQASAGSNLELDGPFSRIPLDAASLISAMARRRTPHWTNSVADDPEMGDPLWFARQGFTSFAGHPLLVDGQVVGVTATFSRKPFSEAMIKALNGVADAIALGVRRKLVERVKSDLEAQLRQAQRMEAVGSLAGGIAHDFNNLLSVILSYSSMLVNDLPEGDRMREDLVQIKAAGERAAALTRQLLAFSRRQILQPRVLDLNEIVAGLESMLHRLIGETIDFATFPAAEPAMTDVDPAQMEQVIVNLAVNARDAMPHGGKLTIELQQVVLDAAYRTGHAEVVPGNYVLLAVSDTGVGMDEATQARIFEPFFTTKEVGKGTGLGLSTVFGIVRQSGGHIWVYSEPGRGTTFKVYLPSAAQQPKAAAPVVENPAGLRGTEAVLLVEDEQQVRKLAHAILARAGYQVIEATDGAEALRLGASGPRIDVLLTDMVMPRVSGSSLAAQLVVLRPGVRVVFMSGYTDTSVGEQGLPPGAVFIQKPFTPDTLLRKVRQALAEAPKPAAPQLAKARVMLVDDQLVMLRLLARALTQYDLVQFTEPGEALAKLREGERFDAIVCDVYMPGMTGPVFQDRLRAIDLEQAKRMLFLTGAMLGQDMSEFLEFNLGRVLNKPIDLEALRRAVAGVLSPRPRLGDSGH
jgi:two-component system cell cycle sensor histidine kinase/response regulator CckA